MAIKRTSGKDDFLKAMTIRWQNIQKAIIARLAHIGEQCLAEARKNHLYLNQTGNLCSSINYCITYKGRIIQAGEWRNTSQGRGGKKDGHAGIDEGRNFLQEVASKQPFDEISFVMVAGMPYAQYVEAMSLNVLDSSERMAEQKIKDMLQKMFTKK